MPAYREQSMTNQCAFEEFHGCAIWNIANEKRRDFVLSLTHSRSEVISRVSDVWYIHIFKDDR